MAIAQDKVWEALRNCYDPEIPINIVDLGLIYDVQVVEDKVNIKMTLTAQGCPAHVFIGEQVKTRVEQVPGVAEANVEIVWDPPWEPSRMSAEARKKLGIEV